ncbi:hypothetical protein HMF8227_01445 [Saliniradius amylolyticus]|uniref:Uncharacterized protein n=1 Tax=Saliniradius amylolyticus TaxID=2183582 RepID=A0A2S2E3U0_9ALTE|nr:hypothetical protein HMF8227_01445 [Saliniradius amylolyticus]
MSESEIVKLFDEVIAPIGRWLCWATLVWVVVFYLPEEQNTTPTEVTPCQKTHNNRPNPSQSQN